MISSVEEVTSTHVLEVQVVGNSVDLACVVVPSFSFHSVTIYKEITSSSVMSS